MTIESLSGTEEIDPWAPSFVPTEHTGWIWKGAPSGPPLLFEARGDAAALLRARASMSEENIEVWEGMRRVTAWKLP